MQFIESDRQFTFHERWTVTQFDAHRYYRWLSGQGLKGVDFVAIAPNHQLLLLEVKNYRQHVPSVEEIADMYCRKIEDSLYIVSILQQYFLRKRVYRWFHALIKKYPQWFGEWGFWTEIADLLSQRSICHFALWIEGKNLTLEFQQNLKQSINQKLEPGFQFHLVPFDEFQQTLGLQVKTMDNQSF